MKKKFLTLMCAMMCIATLFSGCGNGASKIYGEPKTQGTLSEVCNLYNDGIWYNFSLTNPDETTWAPENCDTVSGIWVIKDGKMSSYPSEQLSEELSSVESLSSLSEDEVLSKLSGVEPTAVYDKVEYFYDKNSDDSRDDDNEYPYFTAKDWTCYNRVYAPSDSEQTFKSGKTNYMYFESSCSHKDYDYAVFARRVPRGAKVDLSLDDVYKFDDENHSHFTRDSSGNVTYLDGDGNVIDEQKAK